MMEKKTIGSFIAALRKANGMTQKELAERLHVSDKTVSRWECEDSAPDLSIIPAIAEIFGVTCDELLRGEKATFSETSEEQARTALSPKAEKQRQWLLSNSLVKYRSKTWISIGISILGLIAAMIANIGFLRAYIGFFAGTVFYVASVISQAIWINHALLNSALDTEEGQDTGHYRYQIIRQAEISFGSTAVLFGITVPLLLLGDTYVGLSSSSWLLYGLVFGAIALLICCIICFFLNYSLLQKGSYTLTDQERERYIHKRKWKKICTSLWLCTSLLTIVLHVATTEIWGPWSVMKGTEFYDYESFIAYMELDIPYEIQGTNGMTAVEVVAPADGLYYDEEGNIISEEDALRRTLEDHNGNVLCEYIARNRSVCSVRWTDGNIFPITVCTYRDLRAAQATVAVRHGIFIAVYCTEAALSLLLYFKKRRPSH